MNIQGGAFTSASLNLADPDASWVMAGEMNLSGTGPLFLSRVDGSKMIVEGDLKVTGAGACGSMPTQPLRDTDYMLGRPMSRSLLPTPPSHAWHHDD